jgi:hypothetical protein
MKDEEIKLEEIEAAYTLEGMRDRVDKSMGNKHFYF